MEVNALSIKTLMALLGSFLLFYELNWKCAMMWLTDQNVMKIQLLPTTHGEKKLAAAPLQLYSVKIGSL